MKNNMSPSYDPPNKHPKKTEHPKKPKIILVLRLCCRVETHQPAIFKMLSSESLLCEKVSSIFNLQNGHNRLHCICIVFNKIQQKYDAPGFISKIYPHSNGLRCCAWNATPYIVPANRAFPVPIFE